MRKTLLFWVIAGLMATTAGVSAQQPAPTRRAAGEQGRALMLVTVTDASGAPQANVQVAVNGPVSRGGATGPDGIVRFQGMRSGSYRLRFEAEGFITLERDVTVARPTAIPPVDVALNRAPVKPAEPPPAPKPSPGAAAVPPADPNAIVESVSVVQWLAKNRLERGEPRREGEVLRSVLASASLLQVREGSGDRGHAEADEVVYVINGQATLTSKGRALPLDTGALILVPRGVHYTIDNRGKEPIWILTVLAPPRDSQSGAAARH